MNIQGNYGFVSIMINLALFVYQEYLEENFKGELDIDDKSTYRLNWDTKLIWERTDYPDANYAAKK